MRWGEGETGSIRAEQGCPRAPLLVQLAKDVSCGAFQGGRGRVRPLQRLSSACIDLSAASEVSIFSPSTITTAAASSCRGGFVQMSSAPSSSTDCMTEGSVGAFLGTAAGLELSPAPAFEARGSPWGAAFGGPNWPFDDAIIDAARRGAAAATAATATFPAREPPRMEAARTPKLASRARGVTSAGCSAAALIAGSGSKGGRPFSARLFFMKTACS